MMVFEELASVPGSNIASLFCQFIRVLLNLLGDVLINYLFSQTSFISFA